MKQAHRHVDTRWNFSREGARAYCRDCKKWRTIFETGYRPDDGTFRRAWPRRPWHRRLLFWVERKLTPAAAKVETRLGQAGGRNTKC